MDGGECNVVAFFTLNDGVCGLFSASCCYLGFECEGGMSLYLGTHEEIIQYAMSDYEYELYLNGTHKSELAFS
jgi:hypothetical protein